MRTHPPRYVVNLDDTDDPADAIDVMVLEPFVAGALPFACTGRVDRVRRDAPLRPSVGDIVRRASSDGRYTHLVAGEGWLLQAVRWKDGNASVTVVAVDDALAAAMLDEATAGAAEEAADDGPAVQVSFWHHSGDHARRVAREVSAPAWPEIRRNYPAAARSAIGQLVDFRPDASDGRLMLLHGPPGTGKTTALRALAREWRSWCRMAVVVDPERLYGDSAYLMSVLLDEHDDGEDADGRKWRLLVLEDCDELVRADAKKDAGQALARLLNVTDGLVGQGLELLVAITTNEPLSALHPAVARPGRCFGEIHVDRFTRSEAAAWLGSSVGVPATGATLAELYALRGTAPVRTPDLHAVDAAYL